MPKIDIENVSESTGGEYPARFRHVDAACTRQALGDAVGLSQYGVNLTRIPPGAASALRHWHEYEDEFVYVISGELMLMEEGGETLLRAGDAAGFKAGVANGHQLVNRSESDALCLEIGTRAANERGHYPDEDLMVEKIDEGWKFTDKSGNPID